MKPPIPSFFVTRSLAIALLAICQTTWASDASDKARINKARAEADATLAAQEAECRQRFVVNACLIEARRQHRSVVEPLREELILIDERQRKQRAADRADRVRAKTESAATGMADTPAVSAAPAASALTPSASSRRPLVRAKIRSIAPESDELPAGIAASETEEAIDKPSDSSGAVTEPSRAPKRLTPPPDPNALQKSTERLREIEARRDSVLKRNAERAARKPPSAPLPVPGSPAASQPG